MKIKLKSKAKVAVKSNKIRIVLKKKALKQNDWIGLIDREGVRARYKREGRIPTLPSTYFDEFATRCRSASAAGQLRNIILAEYDSLFRASELKNNHPGDLEMKQLATSYGLLVAGYLDRHETTNEKIPNKILQNFRACCEGDRKGLTPGMQMLIDIKLIQDESEERVNGTKKATYQKKEKRMAKEGAVKVKKAVKAAVEEAAPVKKIKEVAAVEKAAPAKKEKVSKVRDGGPSIASSFLAIFQNQKKAKLTDEQILAAMSKLHPAKEFQGRDLWTYRSMYNRGAMGGMKEAPAVKLTRILAK